MKLKYPFCEGLHFGLHAAPFYTTLAMKRDFHWAFSGIYASCKGS